MMAPLPKLICIVGPTASGKTELAIHLAKKFKGEIVSADSRQIYRGMDIGTAKPTEAEKKAVAHFLVDTKKPNTSYTVGQYKKDSIRAIADILSRKKVPFLVGGTGLYVSAVVNNLEFPKVKPSPRLRKKLEDELQKHGLNYLFGKLTALDPEAAYVVDPKNPRRVIRALEVTLKTRKPFTQQRRRGDRIFDSLILGISRDGAQLQSRITKRTKQMLRSGLLNETSRLVKRYGFHQVAFDAIGYRETIAHLLGRITLAEAEREINKNTIRYAKRQMTWFRKMPVVWVKNAKETEEQIVKFLGN
ncbi:MAG: tRNA dimethylallyltransferase [Parcubacteria group bacterium GW2011_GWA2_51_12]|nr:MAG: tRNA dimethylallyltransferase [Parcubacteria group bacterium GW2011_GWA2_51_12]